MATGGRSVEPDSSSGVAYGSLARSLRRRRTELAALFEEVGSFAGVVAAYQSKHPLEPDVTRIEFEAALADAGGKGSRPPAGPRRVSIRTVPAKE
jgi:hypothetical protein